MNPRLFHIGNVVIDIVLQVPDLPVRGGDTLSSNRLTTAGGGYNVMLAASRQGLPTIYGGLLGMGPFASLAQQALKEAHITVGNHPEPNADTGIVICLIDNDGERTFVTSPGAESMLTARHLSTLTPTRNDVVYISGYSLIHPSNREAILAWLEYLSPDVQLVFDPGPLVDQIPGLALSTLLSR